jgi:hypothetical protein
MSFSYLTKNLRGKTLSSGTSCSYCTTCPSCSPPCRTTSARCDSEIYSRLQPRIPNLPCAGSSPPWSRNTRRSMRRAPRWSDGKPHNTSDASRKGLSLPGSPSSSPPSLLSYGPPWTHYLGGYQDRLLGGPLGLPDLRCTVPNGVKHKDYRGEVLG